MDKRDVRTASPGLRNDVRQQFFLIRKVGGDNDIFSYNQ